MSDQAELFSVGKKAGNDNWVVLTNRYLLLHALASYTVLPHDLLPDFSDPVSELGGSSLFCFRGGVPTQILAEVSKDKPQRFPVLMILHEGVLKSDAVKLAMHDKKTGFACGLLAGPLPLKAVKSIGFLKKEDLEDLKARAFQDVDTDAKAMEVFDNSLGEKTFMGMKELAEETGSLLKEGIGLDADRWRLAEKLSGGEAAFGYVLPQRVESVESFAEMIRTPDFKEQTDDIAVLRKRLLQALGRRGVSSADRCVLRASVEVVLGTEPKKGWVPTKLLQDIVEKVKSTSGGCATEDCNVVEKWGKSCLEILEERADIHHLSDERNIVMRGVVLALLRRDPEKVAASEGSFFRPGPLVRAVAAFLTGIHMGFRDLSKEIKQPHQLAEHFGALICASLLPEERLVTMPDTVEVKTRSSGSLSRRMDVKIGKERVLEKFIEAHPTLRRFNTHGEEMGLKFEQENVSSLRTSWEFPDGHRQPVYVRLLDATWHSSPMARFVSPCVDLRKVIGKAESVEEAKKKIVRSRKKTLTSEALTDMLFKQGQDDIHCRFVFDMETESLAVVVDQLVESLDQVEFKTHLEHVVNIARSYTE